MNIITMPRPCRLMSRYIIIDIVQRRIWTVMLTYDEESAEADAAKKYTIDLDRNCFVQEVDAKNTPAGTLNNE